MAHYSSQTLVVLFMDDVSLFGFYMRLRVAPLPRRHGLLNGDKPLGSILLSKLLFGVFRIWRDQIRVIDVHFIDFIDAFLPIGPRISRIKIFQEDSHVFL